jgi:transposase InsO family protein
LRKTLQIQVGKDTVRKWMIAAGLWQARKRKVEDVHRWRPRRNCRGELVQWDTCVHDWLEGRGERIYLIAMIDDASSHVFARFASHDTAEENMRVLWDYLERFGRPLEFYTDKAAMFEVTPKQVAGQDAHHMPATQITRALAELGIGRISAHSPQAKGRIERFFATAQNRLVKGLRLAGASTLEAANQYLEEQFLPEFNHRFAHQPANPTDAHRPLEATLHDLAASLSHVETRTVTNDYTIQFRGERYQISRASIAMA